VSGVVFDSSVFIAAYRQRQPALLDPSLYGGGPLYLSSVVAHELYVGAATRARRRETDRLWRRFEGVERLIVPTGADWREAGLVLSLIGERYGYNKVGQGKLTNDVLLALSARRRGLTVVTMNARDFALLSQHRPFRFVIADPNAPSTPQV
jgi:predicted nucleic acid-binding protein